MNFAFVKTHIFNKGRPLGGWFAGLPAPFGGYRKLEAVKANGGDPPAWNVQVFNEGGTAMAGGAGTREGLWPSRFFRENL